jgi:hypothetical protein
VKIAFDTEFIEDGRTIDLISIGMVREDGATYYAVNSEMPVRRIRKHQWLMDNVVPSLPQGQGDWRNHIPRHWLFDRTDPAVKPRNLISNEIMDFVGESPEFWAWYADYDWVALCQLFGTMMHLPTGWPMYCRDFKQVCDERGLRVEQGDSRHNALGDALWLASAMSGHVL